MRAHPATPDHQFGLDSRPSTDRSLAELATAAAELGIRSASRGRVSQQIPALREVPPDQFGLAVALLDGTLVTAGDSSSMFSLQSITKLFALCALLRLDADAWDYIGWAPSTAGYSSLAELESEEGRPRNPFVNAGALVVTDGLMRHDQVPAGSVSDFMSTLSGETILLDQRVSASEASSDNRNRAIAHVLRAHHRLEHNVDEVLAHYFDQCALTATVSAVARAALFLADRNLTHTSSHLDRESKRRVNAVLLTAGMYGAAGDVAYRIGLPAKSGIGGGVLAIMPGIGTICVWSPPLDVNGNSVGGVAAIEEFAKLAGWSVF